MIERFDTARRAGIDRFVSPRSRRIVHAGSDGSKTVLMPKSQKVGQFMRSNLCGKLDIVFACGRWLRGTNFRIADLNAVRLESVGISFNVTIGFYFGDDSAEQAIHLHDGTATQIHISGIDFTGQSTRTTGIRCLIKVNSHECAGRLICCWNLDEISHHSQIEPRCVRVGATINRLNSLSNELTFRCCVVVFASIRQTGRRINESGIRGGAEIKEYPLGDSARSRDWTCKGLVEVCASQIIIPRVTIDGIGELAAHDVFERQTVGQPDPHLTFTLWLPDIDQSQVKFDCTTSETAEVQSVV